MKHLLSALLLAVLAATSLAPRAAEALTVSPVRLELMGAAGATVSGQIVAINDQDAPSTFYLTAQNFEAQGETGAPNFVPGSDGLASWIEVVPSVTLAPRETRAVPFEVRIPDDAVPGGNFAAVFFGTQPPGTGAEEASEVTLGSQVGVLVLLRVAGAVAEEGGVASFDTADGRALYSSLPVRLSYRFENGGGDRVLPEGTVAVRNMFGMTSALLPANPSAGNVLPGSMRRFEVAWDGASGTATSSPRGYFASVAYQARHFAIGRYTADLTLAFGDGKATEARHSFYVLPWQLLSLVLLALAILVIGGRFGIRRYNRWIVAQAEMREAPASPAPRKRAARRR